VRLAVTRLATSLLLLFFAVPLGTAVAQSQEKEKVPRVGYISPGSSSDPMRLRRFEAFRQGLRELGYVEGQNIVLEPRWAEGQYARYPALVADLVRLKAGVIVVVGGTATKAAKEVTRTVPIVMSLVVDPVGSGLIPSLAHPGGNVTGTSIMAPDLVGKQLELLKEVVPKVSRVAVLWNPDNPGGVPQLRQAEAAARALGVRLQPLEARNPHELDSAFAAMTRERAGALVILNDAILGVNLSKQIAERAAKSRLPHRAWGAGVRAGRRPHGLWGKPARLGATGGDLRGQDPQGCKARRLADRAAEQARAHYQPPNRQGARADDSVVSAVAGRSSD
jgi:ABC-type uncharacterized transport system substrate-binding protein